MTRRCPIASPGAPQWRRSGPWLGVSALLHAALLGFAPAPGSLPQALPPSPLSVQLARLPAAPPFVPPAAQPPAPSSGPVSARKMAPAGPVLPQLAMPPAASPSVPVLAAVPAALPAPSPTGEPAVKAAPLAVVGARFDAAYLHNPRPFYPPQARRLGEEGKVLLKVRVSVDGLPLAVDVEQGSPFARLDEAARQAVGRWRFVPARRGDEAVEATVNVPIIFRLED